MSFDFDRFLAFLDKVGWPGSTLLALCFLLWKVGKWLKPHVEKILDAHLHLLGKLEENLDVQADGHKTTHGKLELVQADVTAIKKKVAA